MIDVKIEAIAGKKIIGFAVRGHAGYAPHGKDIVCAAVSAVTQTATIGLQKHFEHLVDVRQMRGRLYVKISKDMSPEERRIADAILDTMYWGLESLENDYGEYVKVVIKEVQ